MFVVLTRVHILYVLLKLHFTKMTHSHRIDKMPNLSTVESAVGSWAFKRCDPFISGRSQQASMCFNKCIFQCTYRQERVYGKRESDRHLVFLNRDGMSLL